MNQQKRNEHAIQAIDALGGTAAVSRLCVVAMPSVSDWKREGIPRARVMFLRAVRPKALKGIDLEAATSKAGAHQKVEDTTAQAG